MNDETTLNGMVSEEDARRRERAAFLAGAEWRSGHGFHEDIIDIREREAIRRYPIKRRVPRVVRLARASAVQAEVLQPDGTILFRLASPDDWGGQWDGVTALHPDDVEVLRDLVVRPYEEIDE